MNTSCSSCPPRLVFTGAKARPVDVTLDPHGGVAPIEILHPCSKCVLDHLGGRPRRVLIA